MAVRSLSLLMAFGFALAWTVIIRAADPVEPLLRELPPGVLVERSILVPVAQANAISLRLGGGIQRLTNSNLRVHGRSIQVNVIAAVDEASAIKIHAALAKIKPAPFCTRKGQLVIEYVGRDIDEALAVKTSYELGVRSKPAAVRYQVVAELAAVEKADYMACNPLFSQFLALQGGTNQTAAQQIEKLSKSFTFGRTLVLRNPLLDGEAATKHAFRPAAIESQAHGASVSYLFGDLPRRQGVPFVTATIDVQVDGTGLRGLDAGRANELTAATAFWPADAPDMIEVARRITAGKSTNAAKAMAILEWLSPGQNLKYSGQTGSRWGTRKVFDQKFGHCWDFSDCFVTLARASGVPSRQVAGWFYGSSGHVWAEFYREGKGWQQVDPTGGGKLMCGIYHIPYFTSEDGEMPIVYLSLPKIEVVSVDAVDEN